MGVMIYWVNIKGSKEQLAHRYIKIKNKKWGIHMHCKIYRTVSQFYYPKYGWREFPKKGSKERVSRIKLRYQLVSNNGVVIDNYEEEFSAKRVKSLRLVMYAYEVRENDKVIGMETFISSPAEHDNVMEHLKAMYAIHHNNIEFINLPMFTHSFITGFTLNHDFNFY